MPQVQVPFQVGGWEPDPAPLELGDAGPVAFGRVTMRKTFSGALSGSSVVAMTSAAVGEAPVGYSAVELVTGVLDGRSGTAGALTGTSVLSMTSAAVGEAPVGYSALELVTGTLDGRSGTFVLQHSGVVDEGAPSPSGVVLPGTGTGELAGLRGRMTIEHDESGPVLHLDYGWA